MLAFILIEGQIMADSILIYDLPYLLLFPKLKCSMDGQELVDGSQEYSKYCSVQNVCQAPNAWLQVEVDKQSPVSLRNWIESFDLLCASSFEISMLAMAFFVGQTLTCMYIPRF